jgi:hypothetical protein
MEQLGQITFTANYDKLDEMSDAIADLNGEEVTGNTMMALVMCLCRLMAPQPLSAVQEAAFITDILDYAGAYFGAPTKES